MSVFWEQNTLCSHFLIFTAKVGRSLGHLSYQYQKRTGWIRWKWQNLDQRGCVQEKPLFPGVLDAVDS